MGKYSEVANKMYQEIQEKKRRREEGVRQADIYRKKVISRQNKIKNVWRIHQ